MGRHSCCYKQKLRKGLWSPEEDEKLINHITTHGHGCWSSVPKLAGLQRCGKSCRLRWINYLRPDLKRGTFSSQEENLIIELHAHLGNRWSQIAAQLPGRTDNEIKNLWNSSIKKKLRQMGVDPNTHKPLQQETPASPSPSPNNDKKITSHAASSSETDTRNSNKKIIAAAAEEEAPKIEQVIGGPYDDISGFLSFQQLNYGAGNSSATTNLFFSHLDTSNVVADNPSVKYHNWDMTSAMSNTSTSSSFFENINNGSCFQQVAEAAITHEYAPSCYVVGGGIHDHHYYNTETKPQFSADEATFANTTANWHQQNAATQQEADAAAASIIHATKHFQKHHLPLAFGQFS